MARWWKFLFGLVIVVVLAVGTLPWWLGPVLRPVLRVQDITFDSYERIGYTRFKLHRARYTHPGVVVETAEVQSDTPLLWLGKRLRGGEPSLIVDHWSLRHTPSPATPSEKNQVSGMADLQRLLTRLVPILHRWLPEVQLNDGKLRGFTPEMNIAHAVWHNSVLTAEGLDLAGHRLAVVVTPTREGTFHVDAHTAAEDDGIRLAWSSSEISGDGTWWGQPVRLTAHYGANGWIPAEADAIAADWNLPASRLKLGAPYETVRGKAHATWRNGAFEVSLEAKAEPGAKDKAPAFEANASARGNLGEVIVTALHVDAPFATADLSAPVTFSVAHPLSADEAKLSVKVDLAKLPWIEAKGSAEGSVTVTPDNTGARQTFELNFSDVVIESHELKTAKVRGVLEWPALTLTTLEAELDKTSSVSAHGAVNWETREFHDVALQATVGPGWFSRWLPKGAGWTSAEVTASLQGSLDAPRHEGSVKIAQASLRPMKAADIEASWTGVGLKADIPVARAIAGKSTLEFAGKIERTSLQLTTLVFAPGGRTPVWELVTPARLTWAPVWGIDDLQLTGTASQLRLRGKGGDGGHIELTASSFDSAWLEDWIELPGPHWQVHTLHASGRDVHGVLAFDTTLAGQIAMQPRPAEIKLTAAGDADGIRLKELTVVESGRELTRASGRLPLSWKLPAGKHLAFDEKAPLEISAATDPDSPLWSALSAYTGLTLAKPEAKIELRGTLREPAGEVNLKVRQFGLGGGRFNFSLPQFDDLTLSLQVNRQTVAISTLSTRVDGQALQASGKMPMDDKRWNQLLHHPAGFDWSAATARLEIPDADLASLNKHLPGLIAPKGRLRARVDLRDGGKLSGELHLIDATARPLPPFSTLQEINADLTLSDRTLTVQKLTAKLGSEPVVVDGSVTLVPGGAPRLALGLKGKNLPLVRNTGLLIRNDIDLHADTDDAGVTRISGRVTLRDCLVLANLGELLPGGQRGVTRQPPYFSVEAPPFNTWPLAVEVRGQHAIRIRTTVFTGTASAHFQLGGTLGEPRAVGELAVDQGQVLFPFATFAVQAGTLRLRESDPFHAMVNVNALSQRHDYQLRLEATGQLPSPNVVLSSTPALEAEDVLLMVMTGQPPATDTANRSSAGQRLAVLGAYLGKGIFQDLGFGGESRLEISTGEQVSAQGRETYDFEYKLGRRWSLTGEYDRFDSYNAGLKWRVYTEESKAVEKQ